MRLERTLWWAVMAVLMTTLATPARAASSLAISEFLASNSRFRADENGDFEDWIEIRNLTAGAVALEGWSLTDDPGLLGKWRFPAVEIPANGYLVVFASGKDRRVPGANLHTNFRLSNDGEYLALVEPDGDVVATEFTPAFPPQQSDVSFGFDPTGQLVFFQTPTPGAANGAGIAGRVAETRFSVDRGFHSAPFDLVITCATPGAEIRYTTNGTPPSATNGMVFSGSLRIAGTTVVRAAGFKAGLLPSAVDTHSYLFTADIIRQSPTGAPPPGWPTSWGSNVRDYGMDPDVVNDPRYRDTIQQDLRTLPSFCVTMHLPDLFDRTQGIYANPGQDGRLWERPMSLELIHPDGREGFQVNGGIRIRGGFSRSTDNPKHAFRFFFRGEYGASRLVYPLFGPGGAEEFEGFDLRTFQNYSWSFQGDGRGTFLRDVVNRDLQLAMGQPGERGDYYHLYINGQYFGLFNTCERPEASYAATYFGGNKEDYDVIKVEAGPYVTVATDGTMASWQQLYQLVGTSVDDARYRRLIGQNPDGTRNPDYPVYVDPENLIDYMLVILWGGNLDAPISNFLGNTSPNNYFGIWNRVTRDRGFKFFVHDAEHTLLNVNEDRTGPYPAGNTSVTKSNPQWLWQRLQGSAEFRLAVADRIRRHFFGNGVLTAAGARSLYVRRRDQIDRAVVAESARWGDSKRPSSPFTRDNDWLPAVQANLNFIAGRSSVVLQQLRNDGLYPSVNAPQFNQEGGSIPAGFGLLIAPGTAAIYYTLDGSDPRRPGGAISPIARRYEGPVPMNESATVKARVLSNGTWSALTEADFTVIQTFRELAITEIHYHPLSTADRDGDDFEFIELKNTGSVTLDLSGVHFTNGVQFAFPNGTRLAPGAFAVLVRDPVAFASRYPGVAIAGSYTGGLANNGERLTLVHAVGTDLFSVRYNTRPPWPASADGEGFSLVPAGSGTMTAPDDPAQWRASSRIGGSPGADDTPIGIVPVVVNEILTRPASPLSDTVEIHNPTDTPAPIGGWWLSDDRGTPRKFRIPAGSTIPPRGFVTFSEADFNRPEAGAAAFAFSANGDDVWIFSADAAGNLTGYSDGFAFGAAARGVTFGRHTNSVGAIRHPAQSATTLSQPNAGPRVGPVVINEILATPAPGDAPFVEIRNLQGSPVALFDPEAPTNTWRLDGVSFSFPPGIVLPAGGLAVVTATDPVAFRTRHGVDPSVPVVGPYPGVLQPRGETLRLERPETPEARPDGTWLVPYVVVDEVTYEDRAPWPAAFALGGVSLERKEPVAYADDPANWRASMVEPSPGLPNDGNRAPRVVAGPDREVEGTRFPLEVPLFGAATDDGMPVVPGRVAFLWTQVSGPGPVEFVDPTLSNAVVRLPGTGAYTLRLTADDGDLRRTDEVVIQARRPSENAMFVPAGATWRYLDDGSNQGTAWRASGFNDASWPSGRAQFGYGDGDEATVIRSTVNGTRSTTYYFRHTFNVADPSAVTGLTVHLLRDDGAMVYLNNQLVFRSNMPEGTVTHTTTASEVVGGADESTFYPQDVDPAVLVAGANVLAVEVHQQNATSSDVSFDLRLEARVNASNRPPTADAGPDLAGVVGVPLRLAGTFTDDGLPSPPGVVSFDWRQTEGPAAAVIGDPTSSRPLVTFPAPGTYVLTFSVNDGSATVSDTVAVSVAPQGDDYESWRQTHFTEAERNDPRISGDDADPDGDGQGNRGEYESGTRPRDPASVLRVTGVRGGDGVVRLRISVVPGRGYTLQARADAASAGWETYRQIEPSACECDVDVTVDPPGAGAATRFYRVVTPAVP